MAALARLKNANQLAPGSIEINDTAQALDAARFKRDMQLLDLQTDFVKKRDVIQQTYLNEVAEISGAE